MIPTKYLILIIALMIGVVSCGSEPFVSEQEESTSFTQDRVGDQSIEPIGSEIRTTPDGTKYLVDPSKIRGGGPPKDGIPSIDHPQFVTVEEADSWIADDELVMAIIRGGETRVYPFQIMVWHEIVNDVIASEPILITYCPLCGSGIAFERHIDGKTVEFGTSGKLFNSNLVMYDRDTDSYWQQISGKAIVGEHTGKELTAINIDTVVWREWKEAHPDSMVLSRDTGYVRSYGNDPYGNYYEDSLLFFPVENENNVIHPKSVVFGIRVGDGFYAFQEEDLKELGSIETNYNGVNLRATRDAAGIVSIINVDTSEELVKERDFWFAWYAFHPTTGLFEQS